jgi:hypothetical protein
MFSLAFLKRAAIVGLIPSIAAAANISVVERGDFKYPIISLNGEITNADGDKFSVIANRFSNALVEMNSPGGSLLSGIQIGTIIRLRAFQTLVRKGEVCASACAYAWLAGTERYVEGGAKIGFHAAYIMSQGQAKESGSGNALLGSYLSRIALSDAAIVYFTSAAPQEMNWLTSQTAQKLGLNVQDYAAIRRNPAVAPTSEPSYSNPAPVPSPANNSLEQASLLFVKRYFSYWSADNQQALEFLDAALDEQVLFYGVKRSKRDILKEKGAIIRRWPARAYIERPDSIRINCDSSKMTCAVGGVMTWEARNEVRNAVASGVSEFTFVFDYSRGVAKIIYEDGKVLERSKL